MYQSTFVRYERRGDQVVPVRVTKAWVGFVKPALDQRKEPTEVKKFIPVSITELRMRQLTDREGAPKDQPWQSTNRVESRARLHGLITLKAGDEPQLVAWEAGYCEDYLPLTEGPLTAAQAAQTLDNQLGGRDDQKVQVAA